MEEIIARRSGARKFAGLFIIVFGVVLTTFELATFIWLDKTTDFWATAAADGNYWIKYVVYVTITSAAVGCVLIGIRAIKHTGQGGIYISLSGKTLTFDNGTTCTVSELESVEYKLSGFKGEGTLIVKLIYDRSFEYYFVENVVQVKQRLEELMALGG